MKKRVEDLTIACNQHLEGDFILLELEAEGSLPEIIPGQFVEVKIEGSPNTFLRRPYSIFTVNYPKNTISLLIKIVGEGTLTLSRMETGGKLNLIYPLGNGFTVNDKQGVLFVAGGYGIAPFMYFAEKLQKKNIRPTFLFGTRTKTDLVMLDKYKELGDLYITTEDGSLGEKGLVIQHSILDENKESFEMIYTCGPEMMMKAVGRYAKSNNIECEISLDNLMACGIGACLCCVTETRDGNKMTCTEGPVFNLKELTW